MPGRVLRALVGAALVAMALAPMPAAAQEKIIVKLGWTSSDGAADPYAVAARAFKEELETRSGGRMEVRLFPNRQTGDERPMLDGMRRMAPRELEDQLTNLIREFLLTLRSLIDWYLERLDAPKREPEVEDIPID